MALCDQRRAIKERPLCCHFSTALKDWDIEHQTTHTKMQEAGH
jgi:hypothetical protein